MKKLIDGAKNSVCYANGVLDDKPQLLVSLSKLSGQPKSVRLESLLYALEMPVIVSSGDIQIPLSGRGKFNFEEFHGLPLTQDIYLRSSTSGHYYFFMFDLEKL